MARNRLKETEFPLKRWLRDRIPSIDHFEVRKDIYSEAEISVGFFTLLTIANLIALSGLLINSAPVIIGAMLISPLMGPILSFGYAFISGDSLVLAKSLRKIVVSVLVTILIAALASYLSPLSEITGEITARTTPNIFDLLIAFLSGTAGAAAICTKKNYLTVVPGVAIATAVIPPLSVTGFGFGTGNIGIAKGAFFLFFTNFVAIVLSTCLVFYLYGFRPNLTDREDVRQLKIRLLSLAALLLLISIPLVYTLFQGVSEIKLKKDIEASLKGQFDREKRSRLVSFSVAGREGGLLEIATVVNTVTYLKEIDVEQAERKMGTLLKRKVRLYVEQVKVLPQGLHVREVKTNPLFVPSRPAEKLFQEAREGMIPLIRQASAQAEEMLSPSRITDFSLAFRDKNSTVLLTLKIMRDAPLSPGESAWLEKFFRSALNVPIRLSVEIVPFVPPLLFEDGSVSLTEEMKKDLESLRDAYGRNDRILISLETTAEAKLPYKDRIRLADERAEILMTFLRAEYGIPMAQIKKTRATKAAGKPSIKILLSLLPERE